MRLRRPLLALTATTLLWPLTACEHHFFTATGSISSEGGTFGTWKTTPEGCTRDPADGLEPGQTASVATFVWRDMRTAEGIRESRVSRLQNTPLRLELRRTPTGPAATLQTMLTPGSTPLDASSCPTLQLSTEEGPPSIAGGKPTLGGLLKLDCTTHGTHLRAEVRFSGCEY